MHLFIYFIYLFISFYYLYLSIILANRSLPAQMAMRSKVAAQIMNDIWIHGFFFLFGPRLFLRYEHSVRK